MFGYRNNNGLSPKNGSMVKIEEINNIFLNAFKMDANRSSPAVFDVQYPRRTPEVEDEEK